MSRSSRRTQTQRRQMTTIVAVAIVALTGCVMALVFSISALVDRGKEALDVMPAIAPAGELALAYSPDKEKLMAALVEQFNAARYKTADGERMSLRAVAIDPEQMVADAVDGQYQAVSPDSSIWLDQIDREWRARSGAEAGLVGASFRFAISPVVIAMWEDVANSLGYPAQPVGWRTLMERARSDESFRWSHPATTTASGLLATLAEFYAGAGKTRGLTPEDVLSEDTLTYVREIEKTVRYYGEAETAVIEQVLKEGRNYLDAFVVQERMVIDFNARSSEKLVAIYPQEGTFWQDHPMALLEQPDLAPAQREVFARWQAYLTSAEAQQMVLQEGYRPADLTIPLDGPDSPFTAANGVDVRQPQTTLQVPAASVIDVVRNAWQYTKRPANVYLVADVSGSMRGEKLAAAQEAFSIFLSQVQSDREALGLIRFSTRVEESVPLAELGENRAALQSAIDGLVANGETALLDSIATAYDRLQEIGDRERINAIVVMTDGLENHSEIDLKTLEDRLRAGQDSGVPVVIFCIAYGEDADYDTLSRIAQVTGGQVREGNQETIQQLYRIMSSYF